MISKSYKEIVVYAVQKFSRLFMNSTFSSWEISFVQSRSPIDILSQIGQAKSTPVENQILYFEMWVSLIK